MLGQPSAATTVEAFLDEFPVGDLVVAVGVASVSGIAWLSRRATHSTVTLLIGDTRRQHLAAAEARPEDREEAARFLGPPDVKVLNWYRSGRGAQPRRSAHLKVWAVLERDSVTRAAKPEATAMLVGSANLTLAGLLYNEEAFARAGRGDIGRITRQLEHLVREGWDCRDRLNEAISGTAGGRTRRMERREPVPAARSGCLLALLMPTTFFGRAAPPPTDAAQAPAADLRPVVGDVAEGWADGADAPAPWAERALW